jgi:hypothetical protein
MSLHFDPIFHGVGSALTLWLVLLWAWARFKVRRRGRLIKLGFGIATVLLLFMPFGELPLWSWAFSFCPNPSLPMLGVVCAALWQYLFGVTVFKPADWRAIWIFGAVAGAVLYLHPILFGALDLYYWGWHEAVAATTVAALATGFLLWGNRLGVLLLAALIGYELRALESHNCWDYVVDPFYWLVSLGLLTARGCAWWSGRRAQARATQRAALALDLLRMVTAKPEEPVPVRANRA